VNPGKPVDFLRLLNVLLDPGVGRESRTSEEVVGSRANGLLLTLREEKSDVDSFRAGKVLEWRLFVVGNSRSGMSRSSRSSQISAYSVHLEVFVLRDGATDFVIDRALALDSSNGIPFGCTTKVW
jgi:hypothetical protein